MEKLAKIQKELKANKDLYNKFGGYSYRSAESILEAVKPLLDGAILMLTDEIVMIGERYYVKASAFFEDGDFVRVTTAYAREPETKKGMDDSQITGTASSYARKYALNGLFCIDDAKDADTDEYHKQTSNDQPAKKTEIKVSSLDDIVKGINESMTLENSRAYYAKAISLFGKETPEYKTWVKVWATKKDELEAQSNQKILDDAAEFLDNF